MLEHTSISEQYTHNQSPTDSDDNNLVCFYKTFATQGEQGLRCEQKSIKGYYQQLMYEPCYKILTPQKTKFNPQFLIWNLDFYMLQDNHTWLGLYEKCPNGPLHSTLSPTCHSLTYADIFPLGYI